MLEQIAKNDKNITAPVEDSSLPGKSNVSDI